MRRAPGRNSILATLVVFLIPAAAAAFTVPIGPNFRVNTVVDGDQSTPAVGAGGGGFVVAWRNTPFYSPWGIGLRAQRLDGTGTRLGGELTVSSSGYVDESLVAVGPAGNFLVVWAQPTGGIMARAYDGSGAPQGAEFSVAPFGTSPSVAPNGAGGFVIAWSGDDAQFGGVTARRYDLTGAPVGAEFQVNTYTTGVQQRPEVAADAAGNFVVVWESRPDFYQEIVMGQRYDAVASPLGAEFQVNPSPGNDQIAPSVARAPGGDFVVAWLNGGVSPIGVAAQRYDAAGNPLGGKIDVSAATPTGTVRVAAAADATGDFLVLWSDHDYFAPSLIRAARFESDGTPQAPELQLSTYTAATRSWPNVAGSGAGSFLAVWRERIGGDIVAQRFSGACGDGTVDAGEGCDDGNNTGGDGCEANCVVGTCFACAGAPSSCTPIAACVGGDGCCAPGCTSVTDGDCPTLASGALLSMRRPYTGPASIVFKSKDPGIDTTVGTGMDPVADGAYFQVYNATGMPYSVCHALRTVGSALWEVRGSTATGPNFAYTDNDQDSSPCKLARVKDGRLLRVKCINATFSTGTQGSVGVRFVSGASEYCSVFGGVRRDTVDFFLASGAPAPTSCATPPVPCPAIIPAGP